MSTSTRPRRIRHPRAGSPKPPPAAVAEPGRVVLGELHDPSHATGPPVWLAAERRRSVLVLGPSGVGKTPMVAVPTVLRHHGPAVVASVKSDLLLLTMHHRASVGTVYVFDPSGATGLTTAKWSPLATINGYGDAIRAAKWMSDCSALSSRDSDDINIWDTVGQKFLAAMLYAATVSGHQVSDMYRWVNYRLESKVTNLLTAHHKETGDVDAADALADWAATRTRYARAKDSVFMTAEAILGAWRHPDIRDAVTVTDPATALSISDLVDGGQHTLYLVAPAGDQALFAPVFETLINAILHETERRAARSGLALNPELLLMLDEAANIAPLRRLDQVASKAANEGVLLVSVFQDEGQLERTYGHAGARTVVANHNARIYLAGIADEDTLRRLSSIIGNHDVAKRSTSTASDQRATVSTQTVSEPLAPIEWLRLRPRGTGIVISTQFKPIRVRMRGWYQDPALRALVDPDVAAAFDAQFAPSETTQPSRRGRRGKSRATTGQNAEQAASAEIEQR